MSITITHMGIRNGQPYMEPEQYDDMGDAAAFLDRITEILNA